MAPNGNGSETQQELFPGFSGSPEKTERFPAIHKHSKPLLVTTSLEQLLLAAILIILFGCGTFFLGVLRGKTLGGYSVAPSVRVVSPAIRPQITAPRPSASVGTRAVTAPAPPAGSPAAPARVLITKPYMIQLASYKSAREAESQAQQIRKEGYLAGCSTSGAYTVLWAGQYGSKAEADKDLAFFRSKYKGAFLRRRS